MIQALLHTRKKLFGPTTEVSKHVDGQLSLFDTAQKLVEELANEQKKITVPEHTRKARQPGVRAEMLPRLVQEIDEYTIPQTDTCSQCGSKLEIVGKRIIRTEVEFAPAKLKGKQMCSKLRNVPGVERIKVSMIAAIFRKRRFWPRHWPIRSSPLP